MSLQKHIDYLIVGKGITGTFLSYYLLQEGKKIIVIDDAKPYTASKIASGVINPVTGRRIVKTWMIDEVMPFAVEAYQQLEQMLQVPLIKQCNVLDFHATPQMQLAFTERLKDEKYLRLPNHPEQWQNYFNYPFDIGEINPCWLIDFQTLLTNWRNYLLGKNVLIEKHFSINELAYQNKTSITYQNITASKIIFCDGVAGVDNIFFNKLPYSKNKGEVLIAAIDSLPTTNIYKQGITIVPWKENLFWIGSSYEWDFTNENPTTQFKQKVLQQLQYWLKQPFEIREHWAAVRPANLERRPFVGLHPLHNNIGILNGMGTKGCSLAPFFAHQLTEYLVANKAIHPLANVQRFAKILSK
jgi:glycine/D-amino acid oxidase-like deaminating enzyme